MSKMAKEYQTGEISITEALKIARQLYHLEGVLTPLPGELDFNFRIKTSENTFILKVSRPETDFSYLEYQQAILAHLQKNKRQITVPVSFADKEGQYISRITDSGGQTRYVRLLSWIEGRLWSEINPQKDDLRFSLGYQAGMVTKALQGFDHKLAHRQFDWDLAQAAWTTEYSQLFTGEERDIIQCFQKNYQQIQPQLTTLRKSVVHNDANDNNVLVTSNADNPEVKAIIDYGDAIYTPIINDLAIAIAYAIMNKPDPLTASLAVARGYHKAYALQEEELAILYVLIGMRLIVTITKSAINKKAEPDNEYLLISEKPAWAALKKWHVVNSELATYSFKDACDLTPHPQEGSFKVWAKEAQVNFSNLLPNSSFTRIYTPNLSVGSTFIGNATDFDNLDLIQFKIKRLQQEQPDTLLAGGYLEPRAFYSTDAYRLEGNSGPEYRTCHLGIDIWCNAGTPVHCPVAGKVFSIHNNSGNKNYGPTVIIIHQPTPELTFYSLYGHLANDCLSLLSIGQKLKQGALIGHIGSPPENGNWPPHLHFQLILNMLNNISDYPGAATPEQLRVWQSLCPDPNLLFKFSELSPFVVEDSQTIISQRVAYLGKSLSISYAQPLTIVRGDGAYLLDNMGRRYLDTVNNVAHVGHEHPAVVKAGQEQMAVLNTNTRYLHKNITDFAEELLCTFPKELCVIHFVNSGSEANELALRMTKAYTGKKDMIAIEIGYHGNTNACIDVSSYKFDGKGGKGAPENTHIVPLPDAYRGLYQDSEAGPKYAGHIREQINNIKSKGRGLAGFICESIISCGGQIELPKGYLKTAYKAVREAGGVCIADEVQVGCGRVGKTFWGFQLHGVVPDIVTIGKPIGNGHPLAAVVCTRKIADDFANGMEYFNTFGGNPVSCAIGKTVLEVIKEENLQENALKVGNYLKTGLRRLQSAYPIIGDVRGQGLFLGFELVDSKKEPLAAQATYLANRMKEFGILMSTDGKDNNVLKIKPPMVFSRNNADTLFTRLETIFAEDFMGAIPPPG